MIYRGVLIRPGNDGTHVFRPEDLDRFAKAVVGMEIRKDFNLAVPLGRVLTASVGPEGVVITADVVPLSEPFAFVAAGWTEGNVVAGVTGVAATTTPDPADHPAAERVG